MRTRTALLAIVLTVVSIGQLAGSPAPAAFQKEPGDDSEKAEKQKEEKKSGIVALPVVF
jgi:hypothetical protein